MSLYADSNLEKMEQKFSEKEPFDLLNTPSSMMYSESVDVVTDDRMNTVETSTGLEDQNMFQMDVPKKTKYKHRKQCRSLSIIILVCYYLYFFFIRHLHLYFFLFSIISFSMYVEVASTVTKQFSLICCYILLHSNHFTFYILHIAFYILKVIKVSHLLLHIVIVAKVLHAGM